MKDGRKKNEMLPMFITCEYLVGLRLKRYHGCVNKLVLWSFSVSYSPSKSEFSGTLSSCDDRKAFISLGSERFAERRWLDLNDRLGRFTYLIQSHDTSFGGERSIHI